MATANLGHSSTFRTGGVPKLPKACVFNVESRTVTADANGDGRSQLGGENSDRLLDELRDAIRAATPAEVARKSGVGKSTVSGIMAGTRPRSDILARLADAAGMTVQLRRKGQVAEVAGGKSDLVPVHLVGAPASAGGGLVPVDDELGELLGLSERFLRRHGLTPNAVAACDVVGDSMEKPDGSGIRNGSLVLVDTSTTPDKVLTGRIYVIVRENDVLIKRLERRLDGTLIMHSDNPRYASETIPQSLADQFHVAGEVRAKIEQT